MSLPFKKLRNNREARKKLRKHGIKPSDVAKTVRNLKRKGIWDDDDSDYMATLLAAEHSPRTLNFDIGILIMLFEELLPILIELFENCGDE